MFEKLPELAAAASLSAASALGAICLSEPEAIGRPDMVIEGYLRQEEGPLAEGQGPDTGLLPARRESAKNVAVPLRAYSFRRTYGRSGQLPNRTRGDVRSLRMR